MSDLTCLFRESKIKPSPSKKLFQEERSRDRPKSKHSLRKSVVLPTTIPSSTLAKCHLTKQHLKKELMFYNNQTLVVLLRKTLFLMAAVLAFNILATNTNQSLICSNLALTLIMLDLHLGWDVLGTWWFKTLQIVLRLAIYTFNFYLFFSFILKSQFNDLNQKVKWIVSVNAGINYLLLVFCQKITSLIQLKNQQTPYMSYFQKIVALVQNYLSEFRSIFYLGRPLLIFNLAYWLSIIGYIITNKDERLFDCLFSLQVARAFLATSILLYTYLYFLNIIDTFLPIELMNSVKKQINLTLLRLDSKNPNNFDIKTQIQKYIWKNSQFFWDTQFLAHRYSINYDLIEDHILKSLIALEQQISNTIYRLQNNLVSDHRKENLKDEGKKEEVWGRWKRIQVLIRLIVDLQAKKYLFFIVEQIVSFETLGSTAPVNMESLFKALIKISTALKQVQLIASVNELKFCLGNLEAYINNITKASK